MTLLGSREDPPGRIIPPKEVSHPHKRHILDNITAGHILHAAQVAAAAARTNTHIYHGAPERTHPVYLDPRSPHPDIVQLFLDCGERPVGLGHIAMISFTLPHCIDPPRLTLEAHGNGETSESMSLDRKLLETGQFPDPEMRRYLLTWLRFAARRHTSVPPDPIGFYEDGLSHEPIKVGAGQTPKTFRRSGA